ncbi:putative rRNA methylase [Nitrospira sp. KM1]|uniref:tRNA (uridine(34)/cytosine(34)/5- carboxymethylaminomethyluridine(34)-2'-O)- methyltransferase TrmL n=1 Tax=Nitrospira sp. KM1 TaxID=1936990 RepID=UPI0013A737E5|nr:tRNA (uridine(34)/cytosine(34)/5-carboxymethylaminomethyluridine(34)-2'-O)-methyltransferase TrmL [Nitrospira sp. KM1]BCA53601.1 putative rRNA methylase [Nitrospira sp. KM1]
MFDVVLYEPEIPPNTGNIIRLCANTGITLHLVKPLGFAMDDRQLRRAGLDYHEYAAVTLHENWRECLRQFDGRRLFAVSTKGSRRYDQADFLEGDVFVFGPETRGLPADILKTFPDDRRLRLPMVQGSRSLNLSNAAAVVVYEAWRRIEFSGGS